MTTPDPNGASAVRQILSNSNMTVGWEVKPNPDLTYELDRAQKIKNNLDGHDGGDHGNPDR